MAPRAIRPTADAVALAALYVEATRQHDATPKTDRALLGVLSGKRLGFALQLAEELAPLLTDAEAPYSARLTPIPPPLVEPDPSCPVEEQARAGAAQDLRGTVGTVGAAKASDA